MDGHANERGTHSMYSLRPGSQGLI
jgi:hypothetical protein